jgi:hypothetical protein
MRWTAATGAHSPLQPLSPSTPQLEPFFTTQQGRLTALAFRFAQDNLDVKKVSAPSKNPAKWLIMCFSRLKNIKSLTSKNSGTLIGNNCQFQFQNLDLKKKIVFR